MEWRTELIDRLATRPCSGYGRADSPATEPSALAAMALAAAGRIDESRLVADWLSEFQAEDGSVGVRPTERQPGWPTSLAMLTWTAVQFFDSSNQYQFCLARAADWTLSNRGLAMPQSLDSGHDSTIDAWSWVAGTHSWVEPTALHVLALKAIGLGNHERTRSAVAMLIDRQLPSGGCNYGNTVVLGGMLRPHLQSTSLALLALAGETDAKKCVPPALSYLRRELSDSTTTVSMCWSLLALVANREFPSVADRWLESAFRRVLKSDSSVHKLALIALASQSAVAPIVKLPALDRSDKSSVLPSAARARTEGLAL